MSNSFKKFKWALLILYVFLLGIGGLWFFKNLIFHPSYEIGQEIDSYKGVPVYFNGEVSHIVGREVTPDGYNLGLKYQCVHFVKKFYYQHLNHKMPNSYGNALQFFNPNIEDGKINPERDLFQFTNRSKTKPKVNDLLIFDKTKFNPYGHVAIISKVYENQIEIVQQNAGINSSSRATYSLKFQNNHWLIKKSNILGWLGKR